jgi:hypothetical protein
MHRIGRIEATRPILMILCILFGFYDTSASKRI